MDNFLTPLLNKADSMPFLFLGSGFSRRYLNTPTWEELLKHIAQITYQNNTGFQKAKRKASKLYDENLAYNKHMTYLCDLISDDLDEIWYDDPRFEENRNRYWDLVENDSTPPVKIEIACYLEKFQKFTEENILELDALKKITPNSIAGIITTNYDTLQEQLFDYEVYSSQEELLFHTKYDIGEIYKIHGCIKNPNSILINSDDYKQIELKHKYIAAKLLTIFVEHPIFFLGYSLGDEDIRNILNDIQISLTSKQLKEIEDRLFYVVWDESQEHFSHSTHSINFDNGRSITIKQISLNDYSFLYNALSKNKSRYPVKMLRHVKEDMYNLVLTNDPTERMLLTIPDKELSKEEMEKIEFVYGFGIMERARNGYKIVSTEEIYKDAVFDTANLNPELFVKETLTYALQKSSGYIPIRKYTSQVEYSSLPKQVKDNLKRFNKIDDLLSQKLIGYKRSLTVPPTFNDALKSPSKMIYDNLSIVSYNSNNIELLGDYLKNILDKDEFTTTTEIRRLIRIYDYFKYKKS
ncbi:MULTISPECIES: SIR2 family protein [Enterococcus]|uniref:SIR2 family protein n=1 Tax=Enterococcus TaxID=1350 RepID=UPI0001E1A1D3|nr:SIR2 family protein [Enterococcus faecalis]EFM67170.1 hypothetical protein HMPREF9509_01715 [Enterococcus faecalis TX0411]EOL28482.1 hypothetical protein WO5_01461 [Enterococcus faecalis EnGen0354]MCU2254749.1 SIR2 family protein [Enterococcus faecalis]MDT2051712.1 SIR2 family protein [Enterococcus faecalis]NSQ74186.1 SIR2 family protein [Enterococcus faecalis]